jgi:hypothetical protein
MNTRTFALLFGIIFLAIGILGFGVVPSLLQDSAGEGMNAHGMLLGMFHVNMVHNIVHLLFGLGGLAASRSMGGAIGYFRAVAVIYALLAILGLFEATQHGFGYVELGGEHAGKNVFLHAGLAVFGFFFGWINRPATT